MKTKLTFAFITLLLVSSCKKKEEPTVTPTACISGPSSVEDGQSATYTWCGENEEEVEWSTNFNPGVFTKGSSFSTTFPSRGTYTITAKGINKDKSAIATHPVDHGKATRTICRLSPACGNLQSKVYKGYLYTSKADWVSDVTSKNHSRAIDSATSSFSSFYSSEIVTFTASYTTGSKLFVCVESINPGDAASNWPDLIKASESSPGNFGVIAVTNDNFGDNITYTSISRQAKRILAGKWRLFSGEINGSSVPIPACSQDDYLEFYTDGTWKFLVGADNCSGASLPSNGTFGTLPPCDAAYGIYFTMTNVSGSFTPENNICYYHNPSNLQVHFKSGANTGFYVFKFEN